MTEYPQEKQNKNVLQEQIDKEFAKLTIFKSIKEFKAYAENCHKDLQHGDKLVAKREMLGGFSTTHSDGLVLYLQRKDFKEPYQLITIDYMGDLIKEVHNWPQWYKWINK